MHRLTKWWQIGLVVAYFRTWIHIFVSENDLCAQFALEKYMIFRLLHCDFYPNCCGEIDILVCKSRKCADYFVGTRAKWYYGTWLTSDLRTVQGHQRQINQCPWETATSGSMVVITFPLTNGCSRERMDIFYAWISLPRWNSKFRPPDPHKRFYRLSYREKWFLSSHFSFTGSADMDISVRKFNEIIWPLRLIYRLIHDIN